MLTSVPGCPSAVDLFTKQNDVIVTSLLSWYSVSWYSIVFVFANKIWTDKNTQRHVHLEIMSSETKLVPFLHAIMKLYNIYAVSSYVLINRGNFHLKLLRRFRDIAVSVVGSFILPHPVCQPVGIDRFAAAAAETKSKCKISKICQKF